MEFKRGASATVYFASQPKNMNIKNRLLDLQEIQKQKFSAICTDSRRLTPHSLFLALKGQKEDGHCYLKSAIKKGASALVVDNKESLKDLAFTGPVCVVKNTRTALPILLNEFYHYPSEKMFCIGVTGTNGKTTVSHIMAFLLKNLGWRTGLIGSITNRFEEWEEKSLLTTPNNADLHSLLHHFYQKGAQALVMEVSSIGLDQQRTAGVDFNLGIWTNLSQDHLDYHPSFSDYFKAKKKLFIPSPNRSGKSHFQAIINLDDPYGIQLAREIQAPIISYGQKPAQWTYKILSSDLNGSHFQIQFQNQSITGFLPMPGSYNVSNAIAGLCGVYSAGFSLVKAVEVLTDFPGVPGRLQRVWPPLSSPIHLDHNATQKNRSSVAHSVDTAYPCKGPFVFVDYAHTPSALSHVLSFLKQNLPKGQLYTVFGCGGERDQSKRPLMGRSAEKFSDKVFLTSDNPRGEDPHCIIKDILKGFVADIPKGHDFSATGKSKHLSPLSSKSEERFKCNRYQAKVVVEVDREQAIKTALKQAKAEDIVLIAGKGHETEQIIGSKRFDFSDARIVKEYYIP